ncbi:MAG: NADH-quinone oxidoreductase subunit D [Actinomycetota bacterium]|nr:NADH-quinone oxidoreductase subunit D [Actinomycetota bacterium]
MSSLATLPVVIPFLAGPLLVATGSFAPRWLEDQTAVLSAIAVCALCALLAVHTGSQPLAYWVGGFRPHHGIAIGISLSIDPLGAGMAAFAALLVSAALFYAVHYFDAVKGLFHGLMLLFMAGMVGFCLTGDLFNLVVFFELMSAAAFALTAYRIEERAPIQGAINFAITNSIGGYAMFIGVALLYARTGALNMAQIGTALDGHQADALVTVAMVLLLLGFLTKAAAVPLHFWLADAHAVAPVPVCVLFSGVMVELGIYAVARIYWVIFAGPMTAHAATLRAILIALGVATALLGALMCSVQRHIKRLLAFSTISHTGMFVCGVGLLSAKSLAGVSTYLIGHGLTKGALFMCAGVLLHRFATIDEFDLHGRGRAIPIVGVMMAAGGLLLCAAPLLTTYFGKSLLDEAASEAGYGWLIGVFILVSAVTAGAVLRVTGRVFLGWGPAEGPDPRQARAAEERVDETRGVRDHTPPLMVIIPLVLLVTATAVGLVPGAVPGIERAAVRFTDHAAYARWVLYDRPINWPRVMASHLAPVGVVYSLLALAGALGTAALGLFGRPLREVLPASISDPSRSALRGLRRLHSGHIGDYIAWWSAGAATLGVVCLVAVG